MVSTIESTYCIVNSLHFHIQYLYNFICLAEWGKYNEITQLNVSYIQIGITVEATDFNRMETILLSNWALNLE